MATVYLVTTGSYSDYRIEGAYSTRELAQLAVDMMNRPEMYNDDPRIEEYELDSSVDHFGRGELFWTVTMYESGNTGTPSASMWNEEFTKLVDNHTKTAKYLVVGRWAADVDSVVKIANEIRAQKIALGEW